VPLVPPVCNLQTIHTTAYDLTNVYFPPTDVPDHISLWGLLLALRGPLQLYANVPRLADTKPEDIDWVLVRENSEGEYAGQGGRSHLKQAWETATEVAIFTRVGIERIMRFAFETARSRPRKLLTVVTKSNSMRNREWFCGTRSPAKLLKSYVPGCAVGQDAC
jgi:isocitrate/isopropylmalate dehydrogenase